MRVVDSVHVCGRVGRERRAVAEAQVAAQAVARVLRHAPRREDGRVDARRRVAAERQQQVGHVKMAAVVRVLVNEVRDEHEHVGRAPAQREDNHHEREVALSARLASRVDFIVVVEDDVPVVVRTMSSVTRAAAAAAAAPADVTPADVTRARVTAVAGWVTRHRLR